jgi:transglutaminase-like putative cysteine protease
MSLLSTPEPAALEAPPPEGHEPTDWSRVERCTYVIRQRLRYEYPVPISSLRQQLIIVPPARHGDQRRAGWSVEVSQPVRRHDRRDRFGNWIIDLEVDGVDAAIDFDACIAIERHATPYPHRVAIDRTFAQPTRLTTPDATLTRAAGQLRRRASSGVALAERICEWVHNQFEYGDGVTAVDTTAAEALKEGVGVCQDYAHVMLTVCREAGLPARYISGHLVGEGGSHAWVEVLLPDGDDGRGQRGWVALALDPTHNRATGMSYVTIATGCDYDDVAPTSGTYLSTRSGSLHTRKHMGLASVEYQPSQPYAS